MAQMCGLLALMLGMHDADRVFLARPTSAAASQEMAGAISTVGSP